MFLREDDLYLLNITLQFCNPNVQYFTVKSLEAQSFYSLSLSTVIWLLSTQLELSAPNCARTLPVYFPYMLMERLVKSHSSWEIFTQPTL